jgi:hypothetical protein
MCEDCVPKTSHMNDFTRTQMCGGVRRGSCNDGPEEQPNINEAMGSGRTRTIHSVGRSVGRSLVGIEVSTGTSPPRHPLSLARSVFCRTYFDLWGICDEVSFQDSFYAHPYLYICWNIFQWKTKVSHHSLFCDCSIVS